MLLKGKGVSRAIRRNGPGKLFLLGKKQEQSIQEREEGEIPTEGGVEDPTLKKRELTAAKRGRFESEKKKKNNLSRTPLRRSGNGRRKRGSKDLRLAEDHRKERGRMPDLCREGGKYRKKGTTFIGEKGTLHCEGREKSGGVGLEGRFRGNSNFGEEIKEKKLSNYLNERGGGGGTLWRLRRMRKATEYKRGGIC